MQRVVATSPYLNQPARRIEEARIARARELLPLATQIRDRAKVQADAIGAFERRFGAEQVKHLARLLDDLWMAADSFIADVEGRT